LVPDPQHAGPSDALGDVDTEPTPGGHRHSA
jgi:hypothetical protein